MSDYDYNNRYDGPSPGPGPGNGGQPPKRKGPVDSSDGFEIASWIIGVALIPLWFPVGLFFTVAHSMGSDILGRWLRSFLGKEVNLGRVEAEKKAAEAKKAAAADVSYSAADQAKEVGKKAAKEKTPGVRHADAGAVAKMVFGWILVATGAIYALGAAELWYVLTAIAMAVGGGALLFSAHRGRKKEAAFRRCMTISGTTGIVDIAKLSETMGLKGPECDKMLTEMVDRGYYGTRAYIDHARGLLVIEPEQMRDVYRAEDEAKAKAKASQEARQKAAEPETERSVYDRYLAQIRQADVDIDDEVMSEKIRRIETVTAAIFQEVELHPEKKPQIQRLMNYYLPTTLKLLNSYARIEAQGVTGENMAKAKADIERIADTLVEGYEKQLDTLYRSEAVDIAGDVNVIENMMRRDGLTGQSDFKPFSEKAPEGQVMGGH